MRPELKNTTTACPGCDLLVEIPELLEGERAHCPRCNSHLASRSKGGWSKTTALACSAVMALFVSLAFSYLALRSAGGDSSVTVVEACWGLIGERPALALLVGLFFLLAPAIQSLAILALSCAFFLGQPSMGWKKVLILIQGLHPWCMADVFLLGTLVSLIKLASMANVEFGASFWGYAAFVALLIAAYSSLDTKQMMRALHRDG